MIPAFKINTQYLLIHTFRYFKDELKETSVPEKCHSTPCLLIFAPCAMLIKILPHKCKNKLIKDCTACSALRYIFADDANVTKTFIFAEFFKLM